MASFTSSEEVELSQARKTSQFNRGWGSWEVVTYSAGETPRAFALILYVVVGSSVVFGRLIVARMPTRKRGCNQSRMDVGLIC